MPKANLTPSEMSLTGQNEDTKFLTEKLTVFQFLQNNIATGSMIEEATGIKQKNITRYKRALQEIGRLWELYETTCKLTGHKAWYLTTDPNKAPSPIQYNLFEGGRNDI